MDSPVTSPRFARPAAPARVRRLGWLLIAAALVLYGVVLARHIGAYAGGSDSSGYMNHARLLGLGHVHVTPRTIPELAPTDAPDWVYSALGFRTTPEHTLVPTYPTGVPLWILAAAHLVGWKHAGNVALWLHTMAGVLLTYAAGRTFGLGQRGAIMAAVIIAGSPLYLFMGLQAMSDVPALVWVTAAVTAAWRARARLPWALVSGAAFGMAVLIRPTNALALIPVVIALGGAGTTDGGAGPSRRAEPLLRRWWRRGAAFGAGGLPFAIFFCLHSHAAYGKFLTTGYGDSLPLEAQWIGMTLLHYAHWLPLEFTPVVVAFLALPLLVRRCPGEVAVLGTWTIVFAAFYCAYSCTHETWWYLRFLLPGAPALVIGALLVLQHTVRPRVPPRLATAIACATLVAVIWFNARWTKELHALEAGKGEQTYPMVTDWLEQHAPRNAVIAAMQNSGALFYYTDFTFVRWDSLDAKSFSRLTAALTATGRPLYAALFPFEIEEQHAFTEHMPEGSWKKVGAVREVTIWQWSPATAQ